MIVIGVDKGEGPAPQDPLFTDRAVFRKISPRGLAKNHDRYLYDEHPFYGQPKEKNTKRSSCLRNTPTNK